MTHQQIAEAIANEIWEQPRFTGSESLVEVIARVVSSLNLTVATPPAEGWYVQNVNAGYVGNNPMFWAKGGNGYTSYIDKAELFDAAAAVELLKSDAKKWKAWPAALVSECTYRTVESQHLGRHLASDIEQLEAVAPVPAVEGTVAK